MKVEDIEFTNDQKEGYKLIHDFLDNKDKRFFLLTGSAGTGKTFLLKAIINDLTKKYSNVLFVSSLTHKALQVISADIKSLEEEFFRTLHSLCMMKEDVDDYGNLVFKPAGNINDSDLFHATHLIVDEVSMVPSDIFNMLLHFYHNTKLKFILLGDDCQVPPPTEHRSIIFDKSIQEEYKFDKFTLNEIVRQKADNPVINVATNLREDIRGTKKVKNYDFLDILPQYNFYEDDDIDKCSTIIKDKYNKIINDEVHRNYFKIMAYTNNTVDTYNEIVRMAIFNKSLLSNRFNINDRLIINSPVYHQLKLIIATNSEVTIKDIKEKTKLVNDVSRIPKRIKHYEMMVETETNTGLAFIEKIEVLHEDSEQIFNDLKNGFLEKAKATPKGTHMYKENWVKYFNAKNLFTKVNYSYCITIHKAQGSTYDDCMIVINDVLSNRHKETRHRLLYTALTRVKNTVSLISN